MRLVRRSNGLRVTLDTAAPIGSGGEARVFAIAETTALCAKVYHSPGEHQHRKLAAMLRNAPDDPMADQGHASIAWPLDLLHTMYAGERFVGFLMPRAAGMRKLFNFYSPVCRRKEAPLFNYLYLHRAGRNLSAAVRALHARGYVVGDLNESNVLVSERALVTLVDTDSFQVRDGLGVVHRCPVGKPEFTPPELQGRNFRQVDRTQEHDLFALAVLIFQLLMEGAHPYSGIYHGNGDPPPYEERIRRGHSTYADGGAPYSPMPLAPPYEMVDPELRRLFARCFVAGPASPACRPTAAEWAAALGAAEASLQSCSVSRRHLYGKHLKRCPWCERASLLGGRDPFPERPEEAYRRPSPPEPAEGAASGSAAGWPPSSRAPSTRGRQPALQPAAVQVLAGAGSAAAISLPNWPMAPTAQPIAVPPPVPPALAALADFHPLTWVAGSMALGSLILPGLQVITGLLALVTGALGWRLGRTGRWLPALFALVGTAVAGALLLGAAARVMVPAPVRYMAENGGILSMAFSPHDDLLAVATQRNEDQRLIPGEVAIYDARSGALVRTIVGVGDMTSVAFSPDGRLMADGTDALLTPGMVRIWDVATGLPGPTLEGFTGDVGGIAFTPDGRDVLTASRDGEIRLWDAATGALLRTTPVGRQAFAVAVSPDETLAAVGSGSAGSGQPGQVSVYNLRSGMLVWQHNAHGERALSVTFAPDGKLLASAGDDNSIRLWSPQTGKLVRTITAPVESVCSAAFSPDGRAIISGGNDGQARLWSAADGKLLRIFSPGDDERAGEDNLVAAVAYDPDGLFTACGGMGGGIHIWRMK